MLGVCRVCLARTDRLASRARAARHPVFLFRRCRRPAARVPLLALLFLVSARLLALLCCFAPPAAAPPPPTPPHPSPVFCPPFASWCCRACRRLLPPPPPPPPPEVFVLRPLASWSVFSFVLSFLSVPCGCSAPVRRLLRPPAQPAPPPGLCFAGVVALPLAFVCSSSAFSWLCAAGPFAPPPVLCFRVLPLFPCAGWCWRAVLACSVLCIPVLLLAELCCSECGVPCRLVPCLLVLRRWCGAALRSLVRLRPAACPAVLKRYGVLHPYPLHSLWRSSPGQIRNFPADATAS